MSRLKKIGRPANSERMPPERAGTPVPPARRPSGRGRTARPGGRRTQPGAARAKERPSEQGTAPARAAGRRLALLETVRLSATDISALASMKNVAKCDTWCELQNPANHRVFERKLRPRPSGRGHACLGVTHRVAPRPTGAGRGDWPPARERGGPKRGPPAGTGTASGGRKRGLRAREPDAVAPGPQRHRALRNPTGARALPRDGRAASHCDPRSGGATRRV